jgi:hypothetical protein
MMANIVGIVKSINGKFLIKYTDGKIIELKLGDEIPNNTKVLGYENNLNKAQIEIITNNKQTVILQGNDSYFFNFDAYKNDNHSKDNAEIIENNELFHDDYKLFKQLDTYHENNFSLNTKVENNSSGNSSLWIDERNNSIVDINSDLRQTEYITNDIKQEIITKNNPLTIGKLTLSGDTTVNEGSTATYKLSIDNSPIEDLNVTIKISHINTDTNDLDEKITTVTIPSKQTSITFDVGNLTDNLIETDEDYIVKIIDVDKSIYSNLEIINDQVITKIIDHATIDLSGDTLVYEGKEATYTLSLDKVPTSNVIVTVTLTHDSTQNTDITPNTFDITIQAGLKNKSFNLSNFDDLYLENNEDYKVSITNVTGGDFNNILIGNDNVVTTIVDDLFGNVSLEELDIVYIKLDTDDTVKEDDGAILTHQLHLVDKDDNSINLANGETIEINLTYTSDSTETEDFNTKTTTVTITGDGGSTYSFDNVIAEDFINENTESYTVEINSIVDTGTYFENVEVHPTLNSATGTITDGTTGDKIPNEDVDTIYLTLDTDDTVKEDDGAILTHQLHLVDKDDNSVNLANGETIEINLTYTSDSTETEDFNTKTTTVTITGDGGSTYSFDNVIAEDFINENTESYTVEINSIVDTGTYFENVEVHPTLNSATGTITDGTTGDKIPNEDVDTIYLTLDSDDTTIETVNSTLTHTIHLIDKDGNSIGLANGETIEVSLTYSNDTTQDEDFTNKTTTFTITGDGGSSYNFSNTIATDFIVEEQESYTVQIASILDMGTYFENVEVHPTLNSATGTITDTNTALSITVDEDDLIDGSDDTKEDTTQTASLGVVTNEDNIDVKYQNIIDGQDSGLTSNNQTIYYYLDDDKHVLTASTATDENNIDSNNTIFISTIKEYTSDSAYYEFELKDSIDHESANDENTKELEFNFSVFKDSSLITSSSFDVTIIDDTPLTNNVDNELNLEAQNTNIIMIIDLSGSMYREFGTEEGSWLYYESGYEASRMKAAKEAANNLLQEYSELGNVNLLLTKFGTEAEVDNNGEWYEGLIASQKAILGDNLDNNDTEGLQPITPTENAWTNYEDAIQTTYENYINNNLQKDGNTVVYFLTDGLPTKENDDSTGTGTTEDDGIGDYLDQTYLDEWESFLAREEILSYNIVGFGTETSINIDYLNSLDPQGVEDEGTFNDVQTEGYNSNVQVVTSADNLNQTLIEKAVLTESGNLITENSGDLYINGGADGATISKITIGDIIYTYDGISVNYFDFSDTSSGTTSLNSSIMNVETTLRKDGNLSNEIGSFIKIDFSTGDYEYTINSTLDSKQYNEIITMTLKDTDNDEKSIDLKFNVDTSTFDDNSIVYNQDMSVDAGDGTDTLILATDKNLDFSVFDSQNINNIEIIDLTYNASHTLSEMSLNDIVNMTDSDNDLIIKGDDDFVTIIDSSGWSEALDIDNGNGTHTYEYTKDGALDSITLTIDDNINNTGL